MTSIYVDTSGALACLLAARSGHRTAREAWASADTVTSVRLIQAETRAALAAARRAGSLRPNAHARAREGWRDLWEGMVVIEANEDLVDRAADLAELHRLRGYDAVHLAGAEASGCGLVLTADRDLCRASLECGISVLDLNSVD